MLRFLLETLPVLYVVATTVGSVKYFTLRRRVAGLDDPELFLSRRQRRRRALKELQREDEERDQLRTEHLTEFLKGEPHDEK